MDRLGQFSSPLLGSYSLPSLAEGSEAISEAEEINEVKSLHDRGVKAAKKASFEEAIQYYNEALEIDSNDIKVLQARALVYLQQGNTTAALTDAEIILSIDANSPQGHLLTGLCYQQMTKFKASLAAMLTALDLDENNAEKVTNHIAGTVATFCQMSQDIVANLKAMEPYEKLSEVGVLLFQNKKYEACVDVLEAARKLQTNQKGITMRVLLTLANAHSQLNHKEVAIGLYQECLTMATATHEQAYQTKSLVNIATLHLENGDTHQAIIFYERLLQLETELETGQDGAMPDYWTPELQCGLHLNLSIAYKTIGNMETAVIHAKKYMALTEKFGLDPKLVAESKHNTGMLNEILGHYQEALNHYKEYLALSKTSKNRKGIGQAYGCLASVYAALHNWSLSMSFHQQHIAMATKAKDRKMMAVAHEMMGDSLCLKGDYEQAIEHYNQMLMLCRNRDNRGDATSRCKMAAAYKKMGQLQYSIYYYNEALSLCRKYGLEDVETMVEFNLACINKDSTQYMEREEAQKAFMRLIPFFERKIAEHMEENTHCPSEYESQLTQCYDGMQAVLSIMANKFGCLQYAEAHRKRCVLSLPNFQSTCRAGNHSLDSSREIWGTEHMKRIVSEQNATVLYYSVMDQLLLLWVLQPGDGVVRFHTGRAPPRGATFPEMIQDLLEEVRTGWNVLDLHNTSEPRALPLKDGETQHLRIMNSRLSSAKPKTPRTSREQSDTLNEESQSKKKTALRRLFDLLIAPVMDILEKLEEDSHLIIVPDKQIKLCPFGALQDYSNKYLGDRFRISYIPCLLLLDRVIQNELSSLSAQDELDFQRQQCCKGGLPKQITEHPDKVTLNNALSPDTLDDNLSQTTASKEPTMLNLREVSNPRLASSMGLGSAELKPIKPIRSRESTFMSLGGRSHRDFPQPVPENEVLEMPKPSTVSLGFPTSLEKMLSVHSYSTLTTKTWTGTDITTSNQVVTQFKQISDPRTALVFGCPLIKDKVKIHGQPWQPRSELSRCQQELSQVAECLGTHPVMGEGATRRALLDNIEKAEIVHIATWACLREGILLVTPDPLTSDPEDESHLVTVADILNLEMRTKLVVLSSTGLSCFRKTQESTYKLASAFLSAGAECVLVCNWPVPDDAMCKFFFHFYMSLQKPEFLSEALKNGLKALRDDDRFQHVCHWAGLILIGKDTKVSINEIRHAHLDQLIDKCEVELEEESEQPILNPKAVVPNVCGKEENLTQLQKLMRGLLLDHFAHPQVIPELIDLLDSALKRLHTNDINRHPSQLNQNIADSDSALALLKWLGFHFQAKGAQLACPYIIFPHWNTDELLIPTYDGLKAVVELSTSLPCMTALCEVLPLSQDNISCLIDLMSITKHAPEIQLKVTDLSVHPLWHYTKTRALLVATGFHQVGLLLTFNMMAKQKQLLVSMLQLMLSFSCHKSPVLLYRLDVNLLGRASDTKSSMPETQRLPSLTPLILPRNQLRMSTPWLSVIEQRDEMSEKMKLAKSTTNLSEEFQDYIERAKSWHQTSITAQANETLDQYGRPTTMPSKKVKVRPGATPSQPRMALNRERRLNLREINQRRDYAHFVLQERVSTIGTRKKDGIMKLYLPYVKS